MRTHSSLFLLATLGLLPLTGFTAEAAKSVDTSQWKCENCPYPKGTTGSLEAGVGTVSESAARFGDHSGLIDKGAFLVLGGGLQVRNESGYYADMRADNLGLDARSLSLNNGQEGLYGLQIRYSEHPRHFALGAQTPFAGAGTSSQRLGAGFPAATTGEMPLAGSLRSVDVGYKKKRVDVDAKLVNLAPWTLGVKLSRDVRDGSRVLTSSFFANAAQLVAPVDHVTEQLEVSAGYASRQVQASVAYTLSRFSAGTDSLSWDNPFWPVVPGATRGQLALAPSNRMQQVSGSLGWNISPTLRASADVSVGRLTQDEPFLATTLNPNLVLPPLPRASLDGRVDTFNGNVKLSAQPLEDLRLTAVLSRDVRNNRTAINSYPLIATDMFVDTATRRNTPFDLTRDRARLQADYRGVEDVKLSAGIEQENRSRPYHAAVKTDETSVWGRAVMQAHETLSLTLKVSQAQRRHSTYGTAVWFGAPENPLLRKYQLAERDRNTGSVRADWALSEEVQLGLSIDYADDQYPTSAVGLRQGRTQGTSFDASWALSEQTTLHGFVQTESLVSRQAGSEAGFGVDWRAANRDRFHVLGLGFKHKMMDDKLDIAADLLRSRGRSDVSVAAAGSSPAFPSAETAQDSLKLHASYKLQDNLTLMGTLWHERWDASDWRLDGVLPATLHNLLSLGLQTPEHRVNVLSVALRWQF